MAELMRVVLGFFGLAIAVVAIWVIVWCVGDIIKQVKSWHKKL